ncbi:MAG: hypothetical protein Q7T03_10110 [Deltaproteobacteria bacterium]|nr:hypothetical protein [Deltaproteobacteria bacterium]
MRKLLFILVLMSFTSLCMAEDNVEIAPQTGSGGGGQKAVRGTPQVKSGKQMMVRGRQCVTYCPGGVPTCAKEELRCKNPLPEQFPESAADRFPNLDATDRAMQN